MNKTWTYKGHQLHLESRYVERCGVIHPADYLFLIDGRYVCEIKSGWMHTIDLAQRMADKIISSQ